MKSSWNKSNGWLISEKESQELAPTIRTEILCVKNLFHLRKFNSIYLFFGLSDKFFFHYEIDLILVYSMIIIIVQDLILFYLYLMFHMTFFPTKTSLSDYIKVLVSSLKSKKIYLRSSNFWLIFFRSYYLLKQKRPWDLPNRKEMLFFVK